MRMLSLAVAQGALLCALAIVPASAQTPSSQPLVYTPVAPCRAFATSVVTTQVRTLVIAGTTGFASQGGPTNGCGVPAYATAVALSLTTSSSAGAGHLRAYAQGAPMPPTQALSYRAGGYETSSLIVALGTGRINLRAFTANTVVGGDVTGYFAESVRAKVSAAGALIRSTAPVTGARYDDFNKEYFVAIDRDVFPCTLIVIPERGMEYTASPWAPEGLRVILYSLTSTGAYDRTAGQFEVYAAC